MITLLSLLKWSILARIGMVNYLDYLYSHAWKFKRGVRLWLDGHHCANHKIGGKRCYDRDRLECHHRTYTRLGREQMGDLVILCRMHHALHHGKEQ